MNYNKKRIVKIGVIVFAGLVLVVLIMAVLLFNTVSGGTGVKTLRIKSDVGIFYNLGCIKCHSIKTLGIKGGHVGPDLSGAYSGVKEIYLEDLNDFLKNPSGTMYFVLMFNHLTKRDRKIIVFELKKAQYLKIKRKEVR